MTTRLIFVLCLGAFLVPIAAGSLRSSGVTFEAARAFVDVEPLR